jgi:hypothetical protein
VYTATTVKPRAVQRVERRHGELGRARKDDAGRRPQNARTARGLGGREPVALVLLELLADAVALELGQVVDEQLALEMIDLVLNAHREQAVALELERLAVATQRAHADVLARVSQRVEDARHREAPFLASIVPSRSMICGLMNDARVVASPR